MQRKRFNFSSRLIGKTLRSTRPLSVSRLVGTLAVCCSLAHAQELASLDKTYHPSEPVHVVVTFAGQVELSGGGVQFNLYKLDNQGQSLWTRTFNLTELKRLQPNQYEATGKIPEYAATGVYRLTNAWCGVSDLSKSYGYPDTLHQDITIRVINEKRDPLPALVDLKIVR